MQEAGRTLSRSGDVAEVWSMDSAGGRDILKDFQNQRPVQI